MTLTWNPKPEAARKSEEDLARLCRALGHPARVRILRLLLERNRCICGDLVSQLDLAQSTVSQHLKVLLEAGLITGEIDGPRRCYRVDPRMLDRLKDTIAVL